MHLYLACTSVLLLVVSNLNTGPALLFREDWRETAAATPVTQAHVEHSELLLGLHGPGGQSVKKSHHDEIPNDPWYIWSGQCSERWAISLRHREGPIDLSGSGRIRWRVRQSGPQILRVVLELAGGRWIVSERGFGETPDWHVFEQSLGSLAWRELDIEQIEAGRRVAAPDLSRVAAIGWTDLSTGRGSPASTRMDWIEVYGRGLH